MTEQKPVTTEQIASRLGLNRSTVSRALRNDPRIAPGTRNRVSKLADALGYRPNPAMAAMGSKRFHVAWPVKGVPVAFLTRLPGHWEKNLLKIHLPVAKEHAFRIGYDLQHVSINPKDTPDSLGRILYHRGFAGVIIERVAGNESYDFFEDFDWRPFSVVCLERRLLRPRFHGVRNEIFNSTYRLCRQMAAAGCHRIGFEVFRHTPSHPNDDELLAAARHFRDEQGRKGARLSIFTRGDNDRLESDLRRFIREEHPDGMIFFNSGSFKIRHKLPFKSGVRMGLLQSEPGDIPFLTAGLVEPHAGVARLSVELLDHLLRTGVRGSPESPYELVVPTPMLEGGND